jgi:hypothetical protein
MPPARVPFIAEADPTKAIIWSAVLIGIVFLLFMAINLYRKWMVRDDTPSGAGFTLSDLRKLHKEGQMTDAEFEKAKANLLGSLKAPADKPVLGPRTNLPRPSVNPKDD